MKKNKLSIPASILIEIRIRLLDASIIILMKKYAIAL